MNHQCAREFFVFYFFGKRDMKMSPPANDFLLSGLMKIISELRRGDCVVFGNHGVGVCGAVREKMGTVAVGFSLMASCGAFFPPLS